MAYGRLEVFWPNGSFRAFPLVNPTESIGRSQGNTIRIDAETISRYHFSIIHKDDTVRLTDMGSQNGTHVDGRKLSEGDTAELRGGEEIIIGELRIIYYEMEELPTQPITPTDYTTQIVKPDDAPFHLTIFPPPIAVPPGAHASAELTVNNLTDNKGFYTLEVAGVPRNWVRIDRPRLVLDPHESAQIVINVRPTRKPDSKPGTYPITVSVREENHADVVLSVTTNIQILAYNGFGMALERRIVKDNERFRLHIHNHGNDPLPLTIGGSDRTPDVEVSLVSASNVVLEPGQQLVIQGNAKPKKRPLVGKLAVMPFDIVARSNDKAQFMAVIRGKVINRPILPPIVAVGLAVGLVLLALIVGFVVNMLTAPDPQIIAFDVSSVNVMRGNTLEIGWQTSEVTTLQLMVNSEQVQELTPEAGTLMLDTNTLPTDTVLQISGISRGNIVSETQAIRIYDDVNLISFTAEPSQLVQYVVDTLDLSWTVENVDGVRIVGLDAFNNSMTGETIFGASDGISDVAGVVQDNSLTVELHTANALGTPFIEPLVIEAVPAQCSAAEGTVELREGPDMRNRVVGSVAPETTVLISGRDVTGAWIRVELDGGLSGWGALDAFTCANTFNPSDLLQISDVVPPPTPIPPTATFTPSPTRPPTATPLPPTVEPTVPADGGATTQQDGTNDEREQPRGDERQPAPTTTDDAAG